MQRFGAVLFLDVMPNHWNTAVSTKHDGAPPTATRQRWATQAPPCRLGFVIFLLANAVLFIRPSDLFESLRDLPIYNYFIIAAALASIPVIAPQFSSRAFKSQPAIFCV